MNSSAPSSELFGDDDEDSDKDSERDLNTTVATALSNNLFIKLLRLRTNKQHSMEVNLPDHTPKHIAVVSLPDINEAYFSDIKRILMERVTKELKIILTIELSVDEVLQGILHPSNHQKAVRCLREHGLCIIPSLFDPSEALKWGSAAKEDMVRVVNELWRSRELDLLHPYSESEDADAKGYGKYMDCVKYSYNSFFSGCADQTIHADTPHIFTRSAHLPPNYLNLFAPVVSPSQDILVVLLYALIFHSMYRRIPSYPGNQYYTLKY